MTYWVRTMIGRFTFTRYLLASVVALSADFALFMALTYAQVPPAVAAAGGYCGGLVLHWLISVHFVFGLEAPPTHAQRVAFIVSAVIGMAITAALVGGVTALGLPPAAAKMMAIPISFLAVYAIRKYGIFARA